MGEGIVGEMRVAGCALRHAERLNRLATLLGLFASFGCYLAWLAVPLDPLTPFGRCLTNTG